MRHQAFTGSWADTLGKCVVKNQNGIAAANIILRQSTCVIEKGGRAVRTARALSVDLGRFEAVLERTRPTTVGAHGSNAARNGFVQSTLCSPAAVRL